MSQQPYDKLRPEALAQIIRTGLCYTNEARAMAREIQELREKLRDVPDYMKNAAWGK